MVKKSTKRRSPHIQAQDTALELATSMGWRNVSMADIAATSGIGLGELLHLYPSKSAVISGIVDRIDETMLNGIPADSFKEPARDRLFDIIMARFDATASYRDALIAIAKAEASDPVRSLCHLIRLRRSLVLMLEASGLSTTGLRGHLRLKGLALIYANAVRVWVGDDSADLAKTMAALDRGLVNAEKFANFGKSNRNAEGMSESAA